MGEDEDIVGAYFESFAEHGGDTGHMPFTRDLETIKKAAEFITGQVDGLTGIDAAAIVGEVHALYPIVPDEPPDEPPTPPLIIT